MILISFLEKTANNIFILESNQPITTHYSGFLLSNHLKIKDILLFFEDGFLENKDKLDKNQVLTQIFLPSDLKQQILLFSQIKKYIGDKKIIINSADQPLLATLLGLYCKNNLEKIFYSEKKQDIIYLQSHSIYLDFIAAVYNVENFYLTGNYGFLQQFFQQQTTSLAEISFYQSIFDTYHAHKALKDYNFQPDNFLSKLYQQDINNAFNILQDKDLYIRQKNLAYFYLQAEDYLRSIIFAFEAILTKYMTGEKIYDFEKRSKIKEKLKNNTKIHQEYLDILKDLRNAIAHGTKQKKHKIKELLENKDKLQQTLQIIFTTLLD